MYQGTDYKSAPTGNYTIELIAVNNSCANDTMMMDVVVLNTTGINANSLEEFLIFPNPAKDFVSIKTKENGVLYVYDAIGKLVVTNSINSQSTQIDMSHLSSGTYFMEFKSDGGIIREKTIKE